MNAQQNDLSDNNLSVAQILAGLLPAVPDEVRKAGSAEGAMSRIQAIYETTTISGEIKFSQFSAKIKNVADICAEYYEAIGFFKPQLRLVA